MSDLITEVLSVAYHRNGVSGVGFHVVLFVGEGVRKVGVVFADSETDERDDTYDGCTAVFDVDLLAAGDIRFGRNSFRGDCYTQPLLAVVREYQAKIDAEREAVMSQVPR